MLHWGDGTVLKVNFRGSIYRKSQIKLMLIEKKG